MAGADDFKNRAHPGLRFTVTINRSASKNKRMF